MVERLNGIQEVRGSTPLISTKRDVYAHFVFMSELEAALSVSFSFSGHFLGVLAVVAVSVMTLTKARIFP